MAKRSTKLETLNDIFTENRITSYDVEVHDRLIREIKKNADAIPDYRHPSYVRHFLGDIVMIVFFAILGNANEWGEIESFAKRKEKWLRKYLELPGGIPTDDTIRIVTGNINVEHFFQMSVHLLMQTVDEMITLSGMEIHEKGIISVDGKESCGSRRSDTGSEETRALQTLNVYAGDYGICMGQRFIKEKTNEIPAAQELLPMMDLKDSIVTADAMNCQKETAAAIIKGKGDYVLALKGNQPLFYKEITEYFDAERMSELRKDKGRWYKTVEKEHGGTAVREYYITDDTGWYHEKKKWKKLNCFGMVYKTLTRTDGSRQEEKRYYICSIEADVKEFERAVRGHWKVENNLHWQLDFTFRDDKNSSMAKTGAKNLQLMKKIVLAVLNTVKASYKLSMKRIRYELSLDYENEAEKLLSMLDMETVRNILESKGQSSKA